MIDLKVTFCCIVTFYCFSAELSGITKNCQYCCNYPKIRTGLFKHTTKHKKNVEGMANSVDPDQTAPLAVLSGSALFSHAYQSQNLGFFTVN